MIFTLDGKTFSGSSESIFSGWDPPVEWQGMPLAWNEGVELIPVWICSVKNKESLEFDVFGVKYDLSNALMRGNKLNGFFIEYVLARGTLIHRLRQHRGPVYSTKAEQKDHISVQKLKVDLIRKLSLTAPPRWKKEEAQWPTIQGNPMEFISQVHLPETNVAKRHLTWNKNVYVFLTDQEFKITTQDADYQSAEEHYHDE